MNSRAFMSAELLQANPFKRLGNCTNGFLRGSYAQKIVHANGFDRKKGGEDDGYEHALDMPQPSMKKGVCRPCGF